MENINPLEMVWKAMCRRRRLTDAESKEGFLSAARMSVRQLWQHYNTGFPVPSPDYSDPGLRAAYMLYYYPWHIRPVSLLLSRLPDEVTRDLIAGPELRVTSYACGPCPELPGVLHWLAQTRHGVRRVRLAALDACNDVWCDCLSISRQEVASAFWQGDLQLDHSRCNFINTDCANDCGSLSYCRTRCDRTDISVVQNCLCELLAQDDADTVVRKLLHLFEMAKRGSLFLIVDLNYGQVQTAMQKLAEEAAARRLGKIVTPVPPSCLRDKRWFEIPDDLRENLFTAQKLPKSETRYHHLAMLRT